MPLSPTQTRNLLDSLDHRPRKQLGQNFLIDGNIVRKSIELASLESGGTVVEIGPGLGTLSEAVLEAGCTVHAVELDPVLSGHLQATVAARFPDSFKLVEGDAVKHPRADIPTTISEFKVVANLPYAITTPWIEAMLEDPLPSDMVLMMQKEAADRITANPGSKSFGAISIFVNAAYRRAGVHAVSRSCFYPVPGVDSQLLHLAVRDDPVLFSKPAKNLIRSVFTKRRKQIGNLLQKHEQASRWLDMLGDFDCKTTDRAESIPVEAWIALNSLLQE
ncbi:MAG: 16S rRNA (adenine(1518)-N(6)/adenine(1519)-N(6))-dimethyltransferase RsmA [Puniceicoccaceae bacterium]